jgi:hypothetical protein
MTLDFSEIPDFDDFLNLSLISGDCDDIVLFRTTHRSSFDTLVTGSCEILLG